MAGEYPDRNFISINGISLHYSLYTFKKDYMVEYIPLGPIPGALPIIGGWTAATGEIGTMAVDPIRYYVSLAAPSFLCHCLDVQR